MRNETQRTAVEKIFAAKAQRIVLRVLEPLRQDEGIVDGKDTKDNCVVWEGRAQREKEKKKDKRNKE